jgi:Protein of unknown function (DUF1360)
MNLTFFQFFVLSIACFRLTHLIVYDKIMEWLRSPFLDEKEIKGEDGVVEIYVVPKEKGVKKWIGELLSCYWCTGIWCSIFLYVFYVFYPLLASTVIVILAVSGVAAIIEMIVQFFMNKS